MPAQADVAAKEAELEKSAAKTLLQFARSAKSRKVGPRAKQAFDLVLEYDDENSTARKALGYKKVKGEWQLGPKEKLPEWKDAADNDKRFRITDAWVKTSRKLGDLHRALGIEIMDANQPRGTYHLERAVYYNPFDKESHLGLGHVEYEGFYGTEEDVAFVKRMREIETKALDLAKKGYTTEALGRDQMPGELATLGLEFSGAKSDHFTVWTRGTQENADNLAMWSERGLEFLQWLLGPDKSRSMQVAARMKAISWWGFVWTQTEREDFLKANPQIWQGKTIEQAKAFANISWRSQQGPAMVLMKLTTP